MTRASNDEDHAEQVLELACGPGQRLSLAVKRAAATIAALLGLAVLAAGCGGSNNSNHTPASSRTMAEYFAYSRCMRSHGVPDFPGPTTSGGIGIILPSGLNPNSPAFTAASQACQSLPLPEAHPTTASAPKLAAEVKLAHCMRSHGLPSFPDPNGRGAFDRSRFDESSPAFQTASQACKPLIADAGPLPVAPGPK